MSSGFFLSDAAFAGFPLVPDESALFVVSRSVLRGPGVAGVGASESTTDELSPIFHAPRSESLIAIE